MPMTDPDIVQFRVPGYVLSTAPRELAATASHWIEAWSRQTVECCVTTAGSLWTVTVRSPFGLSQVALSLIYFAAAELFGWVILPTPAATTS